jgi:hypothetical protein
LTIQTDLEEIAYEFMSTAYTIFQEDISETDQKVSALNLMTTTLYNLTCFGNENFDTLVANCISYSGKLLKKNLHAESTTLSAHLYNCHFKKQGHKVMDQLRKSLKTGEAVMTNKPENLYLLVQVLNTMVYYYQMEADFIVVDDVNTMLSLIKEIVDEIEDKTPAQASLIFLENTKAAIREKAHEDARMG